MQKISKFILLTLFAFSLKYASVYGSVVDDGDKRSVRLVSVNDPDFQTTFDRYTRNLPRFSDVAANAAETKVVNYLMQFCQVPLAVVLQATYAQGFQAFYAKISQKVALPPGDPNRNLTLFFKGFPFKAKSPNRCSGRVLPDAEELLALATLNHVASELSKVIPTTFFIVSDGHPYTVDGLDPDSSVTEEYHATLQHMIKAHNFTKLKFEDGLNTGIYSGLEQYFPEGVPDRILPDQLKQIVASQQVSLPIGVDEGIRRFFEYDFEGLGISKDRLDATAMGYQVSNAKFSYFLTRHLRGHDEILHCSVHDYHDFKKMPLKLFNGNGRHCCPWQGVLMTEGGILKIAKHSALQSQEDSRLRLLMYLYTRNR